MAMSVEGNDGLYVPPGGGKTVVIREDRLTFKAVGEETDGAYTVIEAEIPAGGGPQPHTHREDEAIYVVEGEFEIQVPERSFGVSAGAFVTIPREVEHSFRNTGDGAGKLLILFSPAGAERELEEQALGEQENG